MGLTVELNNRTPKDRIIARIPFSGCKARARGIPGMVYGIYMFMWCFRARNTDLIDRRIPRLPSEKPELNGPAQVGATGLVAEHVTPTWDRM